MNRFSRNYKPNFGFTLIEVLVVVTIIGLLVAILLPALAAAQKASRLSACSNNQHQISIGLFSYATDAKNHLPRGPDAHALFLPVGTNWNNLGYTLVWIPWYGSTALTGVEAPGAPDGLGLLVKQNYLIETGALFCPGDPNLGPQTQLQYLTQEDPFNIAHASYNYRQLDQTTKDSVDDLGKNDAGNDARALMFDFINYNFGDFVTFDAHPKATVNMTYLDGHVVTRTQTKTSLAFTADLSPPVDPDFLTYQTALFAAIETRYDQLWVDADFAETSDPTKAPVLP